MGQAHHSTCKQQADVCSSFRDQNKGRYKACLVPKVRYTDSSGDPKDSTPSRKFLIIVRLSSVSKLVYDM